MAQPVARDAFFCLDWKGLSHEPPYRRITEPIDLSALRGRQLGYVVVFETPSVAGRPLLALRLGQVGAASHTVHEGVHRIPNDHAGVLYFGDVFRGMPRPGAYHAEMLVNRQPVAGTSATLIIT